MTQTNVYNPELPIETAVRALKEYAETQLDKSVMYNGTPQGHQIYQVVMEFPASQVPPAKVPLSKNVVHFEIDEVTPRILGLGDNIFADNFNDGDYSMQPQEGSVIEMNWDVGVWTSDKTGGTTARMRAYQTLQFMFNGALAITRLRLATDSGDGGLEILKFEGGRFITERVNDIDLFRITDSTLTIRIFTRTPKDVVMAAIEDISQDPHFDVE
jgi:hypothetical protein